MEEAPVCTICLSDVTDGWKTVCGHYFHGECLDPWLKLHVTYPTCPNCNALCWPGSVDHNFELVLFVAAHPAPNHAANIAAVGNPGPHGPADGGMEDVLGANNADEDDDVVDVAWVANNPNAGDEVIDLQGGFDGGPLAIGGAPNNANPIIDNDVIWVQDIPAAEYAGENDAVWVADFPAPHPQPQDHD